MWLSSAWPRSRRAASYPPGLASSQTMTARCRKRWALMSSPVARRIVFDHPARQHVRIDGGRAVALRKQPGRSPRTEFRTPGREVPVDHPDHVGGKFELDAALVLGLVLLEDEIGAAVARAMDVPLEMDLRQVLHPERA